MTRWRRGGSRGSVSVEMAVLTPAFLLLIVLGIVQGRIAVAANAIDVAAHDAARAASISRTQAAAEANAIDAATQVLDQQGLDCAGGPDIPPPQLDGFTSGSLEPSYVSVSVTCQVSFVDIRFMPFIPASHTITSTFISPVDVFREHG